MKTYYAKNIKWLPCGTIKPGSTPTQINVSSLTNSKDKDVIKDILEDKYGFMIESFELVIDGNIHMKTYNVYITIKREEIIQVEANTPEEARDMAQRLTDNGSYATLNQNCYDSNITVNEAEEVTKTEDIENDVVEDNKNYLEDLED